MGHGQDGLSLTGQSRGNNEGPMIVSWPYQNLLIPFGGSPLPSRANPDSSLASTALWELAYLSFSPNPHSALSHHTLSFSYARAPCLQAFAYAVPPAWDAPHAHTFT